MKNVGSFSAEKKCNENVKKITKVIKPLLSKLENFQFKNLKCISYKSQVVAGTNYLIKIKFKNQTWIKNKYIHIIIFEPLVYNLKVKYEILNYQVNKQKNQN